MKKTMSLMIYLAMVITLKAQFVEDALRYTIENSQITPRSAGFGYSYYGIVDDIASLKFNPAGLSLIKNYDLSLGIGFTRNSIETDFLQNKNKLNANSEYLTHIGFIAPVKSIFDNTVLAIGYFFENDFKNTLKINGFNTKSTFISDYAKYGPRNYDDNLATFLSLANDNFYTPIIDSLNQSSFIRETGGLHSIIGGMAFDVSDNFAIGFTLQGKWGEFRYNREFEEYDIFNKYKNYDPTNFTDIDFERLILEERIIQSVGAFSASIGFLFKLEDKFRIGGNIKLPNFYEVDEDFSQRAWAKFDNGDSSKYAFVNKGVNNYNTRTPFVYSLGASIHFSGLIISAGLQYSDLSLIEFSGRTSKLDRLNKVIIEELVGQLAWGAGAEYELPNLPLVVRGSYSMITSPYSQNIEKANKNIFAAGIGFYPMDNLRIDLVVRYSDHRELRTNYNYGAGSQFTFAHNPLNIGAMFTYRFSR